MRLSLCLVVAVLAAGAWGTSPDVDFGSMRVKQLKAFLDRKGAECLACSSKEDLVQRATEVKDWPDAPEETPSEEEMRKIFENLKTDDEKMKKLKEELAKSGVDISKLGGNVFAAEDLQNAFGKKDAGAKGDDAPKDEAAADDKESKEEL